MKIDRKGAELMHTFEGLRLTAYPDPGSRDGTPWTIGWGSTGPDVKRGVVWTKEQADARFLADVAKFEDAVTKAVGTAVTTQNQFNALVSICYNIGIRNFTNSTLLRKHKAGDYRGAYHAFSSWKYNDGKIMAGLVRRRNAEAAMYRS